MQRQIGDIFPIDIDFAPRSFHQAAYHVKRGRFPRTVRPKQTHNLTRTQFQTDPSYDLVLFNRLDEIIDF
jgi:hypothetical protein